jgi:uncharacterized protein (DUF433 family)
MKYGVVNFDGSTVNGLPVFDGTNVAIQILFEYLEDGKTLEKFLNDYPAVNKRDAVEVIQLAKLAVTNEKILKANYPLK